MYKIGKNTIIYPKVRIENNSIIEENCIIGYNNINGRFFNQQKNLKPHFTLIGNQTLVRSGSIIYAGAKIGNNCWINHNAIIREETIISDNCSIGCQTIIEKAVYIGEKTSIHNNTHIPQGTIIESCVFVGPGVTMTNNSPIDHQRNIPHVVNANKLEFGCVIGGGAILCPGVIIGKEAIVGAGAVVTKNVAPRTIVVGNPAVKINDVSDKLFIKKQ